MAVIDSPSHQNPMTMINSPSHPNPLEWEETSVRMGCCQLDGALVEKIGHVISYATLIPPHQAIYCLFPRIAAWFAGSFPIQKDTPTETANLDNEGKKRFFTAFEPLVEAAGISRTVTPYTQLNHIFWHAGARWSLTSPVVFIPNDCVRQLISAPNLTGIWDYSGNETRFLIARELSHIQGNYQWLRLAIKVAAITIATCISSISMSPLLVTTLIVTVVAAHVLSGRYFTGRADRKAYYITRNHFAACAALEKMRAQNIERRKTNLFCRLFITKLGNNWIDITSPFLTTRIAKLKEMAQKDRHAVSSLA